MLGGASLPGPLSFVEERTGTRTGVMIDAGSMTNVWQSGHISLTFQLVIIELREQYWYGN